MSQWMIVVPLLNEKVITSRGPCYFGDKISLRTIADETYGLLYRHNYRPEITTESKCLYFDIDETESDLLGSDQCGSYTRGQARKVQTLLNILSDGKPALLAPAAVICKNGKTKVEIVDLWAVPDIERQRKQHYRFASTTKRNSIEHYTKLLTKHVRMRT